MKTDKTKSQIIDTFRDLEYPSTGGKHMKLSNDYVVILSIEIKPITY